MKLKTLVLIGSLIAFSSCEKEDSEDIINVNVNELSLDSRLFGNWYDYDDPTTNPSGSGQFSFSSDGRYAYGNWVTRDFPYRGDYFITPNEPSNRYDGIIYMSNVPYYLDATGYFLKGDTLIFGRGGSEVRYIKR